MKWLFYLLLVTSVISCSTRCDDIPMPLPVYLHVVDSRGTIDFTKANLFWHENGAWQSENNPGNDYKPFKVIYPTRTPGYPPVYDSSRPLLMSTLMINVAGYSNTDTFYLDYGNGEIDTLLVDVNRDYHKSRGCSYTKYSLKSIGYKGTQLPLDTFDEGQEPVYLLKRQ